MSNLYKRMRDDEEAAPRSFWIGEHRLLSAVLQRAVNDYLGSDMRLAEQAEEWLFDGTVDPPYESFSYAWVCEELDLNLELVLEAIREKKSSGSSSQDALWWTSLASG
jgi:hypothetical protein